MSNRKSHRAASPPSATTTGSTIPLAQPSRTPPSGPTLVELATSHHPTLSPNASVEEAQWEELTSGGDVKRVGVEGGPSSAGRKKIMAVDEDKDAVLIGPAGDAVVYAVSLTMLHFTLGVLAMHQYAMEPEWENLARGAIMAFFPIYGIVYILHSRSSQALVQLLFFGLAIGAGGFLIYAVNELGYYAVMKRAPALGTLWVWSVIELRLELAVASLAACGAWLWWGGWSLV
ncbi:MAG: hypothetical protein M1814_003032 [Vezdaea aestivalis]|nr:MAG: hypothetical protein M1814_003032 [Vezdaea aestivalis]